MSPAAQNDNVLCFRLGVMAPKEKVVKGQRPISSFFFKKPDNRASLHGKHELGNSAAPQPPSKRQKREGSQLRAAGEGVQASGTPAGLTDAQIEQPRDLEPIDLTEAHHERSGQPSCGASLGTTRRAQVASYSKDARHQRFQNKLVLGPASGLERDKTVVPQKTTPLEDQVYALKRKHLGILLLIEVCSRSTPPAIAYQTHNQSERMVFLGIWRLCGHGLITSVRGRRHEVARKPTDMACRRWAINTGSLEMMPTLHRPTATSSRTQTETS